MDIKINEEPITKKTKQIIGVQMDSSLVNQIKSFANNRFISVSDAIRLMILDYFNTHNNE